MKIWITGIAGFLGSHLRDALLAEGHEVYGNDNLLCGDISNVQGHLDANAGANMALADCRDYDRMLALLNNWKPDVLVHAAATAHEGLSVFSPAFITKNIYEASVTTFSAAISACVGRIVNMSSMSRYGRGQYVGEGEEHLQGPPFMEDYHWPSPVDPYGIAKVAAEDTLRMLGDMHGIKYCTLVPHNIIGPRQRSIDPFRNVAAIMINRCKLGKPPIIYGDGKQTRCFSPVKDCIPSIVGAVHGDADGEVVNIGPDTGEISINTLARKIMNLTWYNGDPVYMPDRPAEVKEAYCSSDKARRLLGYKEVQGLDDCLAEMVEYINPHPFDYGFPLEIVSEKTPKVWTERLM